MEANFRRAMLNSGGDATVVVERPISPALLSATTALRLIIVALIIRRTGSSVPAER